MLIVGSFDQTGSPTITIRVTGNGSSQEYLATIDTGFTGFLSLNIHEMITLNLATVAAADVTLADGSSVTDLIAEGTIVVGDRSQLGTILLSETSSDVLVGMDFLRSFELGLTITATTVVLYNEGESSQAILNIMNDAPSGAPNTSPTFTSSGGGDE